VVEGDDSAGGEGIGVQVVVIAVAGVVEEGDDGCGVVFAEEAGVVLVAEGEVGGEVGGALGAESPDYGLVLCIG
jgi:hypothetical protein